MGQPIPVIRTELEITTDTSLKKFVRNYVSDVWSDKRLDLLPMYLAPHCRLTDLYGEKAIFGLDAVRKSISDWFLMMEDIEVHVMHAIEDGHLQVAWQWSIRGTWSKKSPISSTTIWPAGDDLVLAGITFSTVENDLIVLERTQSDIRGLIEQLGFQL